MTGVPCFLPLRFSNMEQDFLGNMHLPLAENAVSFLSLRLNLPY